MMNRLKYKKMTFIILITLFLLNRCDITEPENPGQKHPNSLPETTIVNVPPDNSPEEAYFYRIKLYWDGGDTDGYITGYKYKINDNPWTFTKETFIKIDFSSPDTINYHEFQVKAVDDAGGEDPTPAMKRLCTKQTDLPETEILFGPPVNKAVFILSDTTSIWKGIEFLLSGTDSDGEIIGYEYAIDDSNSWQMAQSSSIKMFGDFEDGEHTFFARAVDNAMGVDPSPVRQSFSVIQPTLQNKILVVDETRDGVGSSASPDDQMVDDFYRSVLSGFSFDEYDLNSEGSIDARTFAEYEIVVWHDDERSENLLKNYIEDVKSYLRIGGKLLISGWRTLENMDNILTESHYYNPNEFGYEFLRLELFKYNKDKDFVGAKSVLNYPNLDTDPNKMLTSYNGQLNYCNVLIPFDSNDRLYLFDSATDNPDFEDLPCAVRHFTDSYRVIALGFPLYIMNEDQAKDFMDNAINDFRN